MTDRREKPEPGSDELMGDVRLERIALMLEEDEAAIEHEERLTASQPVDGPG